MISETKSNKREPYRLDHNSKGGGIMLLIRGDIPSKLLSIEKNSVEAFYIEVNLRKIRTKFMHI